MHLLTYVVIPAKGNIEKLVAKALAPFDENKSGTQGEWDWYQIGGRWTGYLDGYDPETDPANRKPCNLCGATGKRAAPPNSGPGTIPCNQCRGTGIMTLWPTEWKFHNGDIQPVSMVLANFKSPYALVLNGEWIADEPHDKEGKVWNEKIKQLLASIDPTLRIAVVDCHD